MTACLNKYVGYLDEAATEAIIPTLVTDLPLDALWVAHSNTAIFYVGANR